MDNNKKTKDLEENEKPSKGKVQENLIHELEELTHTIEKQNSKWSNFMGGVIKGIGYAVGATLLFGLLITILSYIVRTSDASWIKNLADWAQLSDYIN